MTETNTIQATLHFRLAKRNDLVVSDKLNIGLEFWLLTRDKKRLSGKHVLAKDTDVNELNSFFKQERMYVLQSCLDKNILINAEQP